MTAHLVRLSPSRGGQTLYNKTDMVVVWAPGDNTGSISMSATATTYVRTTGSFVDDGFDVGDVVVAAGFVTAGNNGRHRVTAVVALTLTVEPVDGQTRGVDADAAGRSLSTKEYDARTAAASALAGPDGQWSDADVTELTETNLATAIPAKAVN